MNQKRRGDFSFVTMLLTRDQFSVAGFRNKLVNDIIKKQYIFKCPSKAHNTLHFLDLHFTLFTIEAVGKQICEKKLFIHCCVFIADIIKI